MANSILLKEQGYIRIDQIRVILLYGSEVTEKLVIRIDSRAALYIVESKDLLMTVWIKTV